MAPELQARLQAALGDAYRIERELGGGGMSRVFLAEESALGRKVVVKVLPPDLAAVVNVDRFRREIHLAASLQHPHIVPLLAAGSADGLLYYTMPLVEGESLRAKLAREAELPVNEAIRLLRDVADALACAHEHGVLHRDIKPDNILVSRHHALVADFGVGQLSGKTGKWSTRRDRGPISLRPVTSSEDSSRRARLIGWANARTRLVATDSSLRCGGTPIRSSNHTWPKRVKR